jgi:hypothetical protein
LESIQKREINSEKSLVFQIVILQCTREVKRSKDIQQRISRRIDAWEKGKFAMLVQETERDMQTYLSNRQGTTTPKQQANIFDQKMLQGDVRGAVRYLTDREVGGVLLPSDMDEKTGLLRYWHPSIPMQG